MRQIAPVGPVALALLLSACGGSPAPVPQTSTPPGPATTQAPSLPARPVTGESQPAGIITSKPELPPLRAAGPKYEARGRRDPFDVPEAIEGSATTTVASARLTGILRNAGGRIKVLIETSDGLGYILQLGEVFGDGRLVEVGQDTATFTVNSRSEQTNHRVVLRLGG